MPTFLWPLIYHTWAIRWSVEVMHKPGISSFLTWRKLKIKLLMFSGYSTFILSSLRKKEIIQDTMSVFPALATKMKSSTWPCPTSPWATSSSSPCPVLRQSTKVYVCVWDGVGRRDKRRRKSMGTVAQEDGLEFTQHLDLAVFAF